MNTVPKLPETPRTAPEDKEHSDTSIGWPVLDIQVRNPKTDAMLAVTIDVKDPTTKDCFVLSHGLLSTRNSGTMVGIAKRLPTVNTVRFDFSGMGDSTGELYYGRYDVEVVDVDSLIKGLVSLGWNPIHLLGHSKGASDVLFYGASLYGTELQAPPLRSIIALTPRWDQTKAPAGRFSPEQLAALEDPAQNHRFVWKNCRPGVNMTITKEDYEFKKALDMRTCAPLAKAAVDCLLIAAGEDAVIPPSDTEEYLAILPDAKHTVIAGADHSFKKSDSLDALADELSKWIKTHASPSTSSS
eukprot:Clim_evm13s159 gene=Clim_evmTU13s159